MSIVSKLKKNELKLVAEKIGLTVPGNAKMIDLKRLIEESDVFKKDYEFVKSVIEQVLEEVKTQKSQLNGEIELERLKLERVKAELKLAKLRSSANNSETSLNGGETEASIDFDTLKEPIVSDKMFQTIDRETAAHINIRPSGDWFRPLQLGKECDLYFTSSDERKILCVGGRLRHSNLPAEQKDPMLTPNNHLICDLTIKHHFSYLHTGAEATLANIRTKFWIVNGRSKVKRVIKQCIKCLKVSAKGKNQMMADLPSARVSIARVFNKVGLDFCGPFLIKLIPGRAKKVYKCFICIFVCFVVRAIHLEIVSNLSIEAALVKGEDNSKLLNWNLAKIVEVHPGTDDITRVVTLKTGKGVYKRPVTKIVKLPFNCN
ncbi:uncharacterized protein TNCT_64371 [Trichonephila clavata]|uniref:Integrase zinc-binding domain-containing protein n=1 Tax=Trichonephila clavata TaxID=2740835 RepID=A0A8X6J7T0_TRICU|nr:uncharacterized protein TNCT_64371 [Trichonephila clavata]